MLGLLISRWVRICLRFITGVIIPLVPRYNPNNPDNPDNSDSPNNPDNPAGPIAGSVLPDSFGAVYAARVRVARG